MKRTIFSLVLLSGFVLCNQNVYASIAYSQVISLQPGWNIVSTPRVLESHSFSTAETSDNFDIYALNSSSSAGWSTLAELGQSTFTPLFGYFVNNKTGTTTNLTLNYKANVQPNERLFQRSFTTSGWYSIGIANPTYAKNIWSSGADTNNQSNILSLLGGNYDSVIDFTDAVGSINIDSVALTDPWKLAVASGISGLNDFREMKGYAIYIVNAGTQYLGFQNNDVPVCSDGNDNDNDGLIDMNDPGCSNSLDQDETDLVPATLTVSTNSGTVQDSVVIAASGSSENEKDGVELLKFDLSAQNDAVTLTDLTADITHSGNATAPTAYLYSGSTLIASVSVSNSLAVLNDIDFVIPSNQTKTLTLKVDIRNAGVAATTFNASISSNNVTTEDSNGTPITEYGSALGKTITVRKIGPEITLISKSITYIAAAGFAGATSTSQADFVVRMKAVGGSIEFGDSASTTYPLVGQGTTPTSSFVVYVDGSATVLNVSSSTSITIPSGASVSSGSNSWVLGEGNTIDIPISFIFSGRDVFGTQTTTGSYTVALERINWNAYFTGPQIDTFTSGNSIWKTSSITMP